MKLRTKLYAVLFALVALLASRSALADLNACVQKCTDNFKICITGQEANLQKVCPGVKECEDLGAAETTVFNGICALCVKGATTNCPSAPPPAATATEPSTQTPPPPPDTFESRCKFLGGEPITDVDPNTQKPIRICLTLRGLHHRLSIVEAKMGQYKSTGQPVPPVLQDQARREAECTQRMLDKIKEVSGQLSDYEETVKQLVSDILGKFGKEIKRIDKKNAEQDGDIKRLQDAVNAIPPFVKTPSSVSPYSSVSVKPALLGLYVGPYYNRNLRDQYGVALHAAGVEMGLLPSLSENGRWRLEINFGAGYGGRNKAETATLRVTEHLWEMHGHVGPRYTWDSGFALTGGLGMSRRATFSHDDAATTWIGPIIQPSLNLTGKDGHGVYILGRLGVGNNHYQHAILDVTGNKLDFVFNIGLGYAFGP